MMPENIYKQKFIGILNSVKLGWEDGDAATFIGRKADIINPGLKIAIEIKDDAVYKKLNGGSQKRDLRGINRQFKSDVKDANDKFVNYPGYQTVILLRTEVDARVIKMSIEASFQPRSRSSFFLPHDRSSEEVGGLLFDVTYPHSPGFYFCINSNPNVDPLRVMTREDIEEILGRRINAL